MLVRFAQTDKRLATNAFSLIEVLIAFVVLSLVMAGLMFGYVQANRMAEWSSMSLAAQSFASEGAEQTRAANWRPRDPCTNTGPNTAWETWPGYMMTNIGILDIPISGNPASNNFPYFVTNYVTVTEPTNNPYLLEIQSVAYWIFPRTGQQYSNIVILQRAPDQ
jgi:type II secretory pathway pseudopilin PulG